MVSRSVVRRKISRIEEHIRRIRAIPPVSLEEFKKDTMSQDVFLFNITQAIQNCIDIAAHIVSDEEWGMPGTQSESFEILREKDVISPELVQKLIAMSGFRNRIIHEEKLDIEMIYEVWQKGFGDLERFCLSVVDRFKL
jgi:uncharacterized protein YutE (UPF0331/DUF86 family)